MSADLNLQISKLGPCEVVSPLNAILCAEKIGTHFVPDSAKIHFDINIAGVLKLKPEQADLCVSDASWSSLPLLS